MPSQSLEPSPPKRGRGQPPFKPTPEQRQLVEGMAAYGIPHEAMCLLIQNSVNGKHVARPLLERAFHTELKRGEVAANVKVIGGLFKNATTATDQYPGGNPICQIFWAKTRLRWKDHSHDLPPPLEPTEDEPEIGFDIARRIAFALDVTPPKQIAKPKKP